MDKMTKVLFVVAVGFFLGAVTAASVEPAHAGMSNGITENSSRMADALDRIAERLEKCK